MLKRLFARNAVSSVAQVFFTSTSLFIVYWYVARTIGLADLGTWSVVLATTSVSSIANLGIASSTVKFVAMHLARNDEPRAVAVIGTSLIAIAVVLGVVLLFAYPAIRAVLAAIIPGNSLADAFLILPYALVGFWLASVSATLHSAIDGYHRIDLRAAVIASGSVLFTILVFVLTPTYGLLGLAIAQLVQAFFVLIISGITLRRVVPKEHSLVPRWSTTVFREIFSYSVQFQSIAILRTLFEPVTKGLLAKFGTLEAAGLFEMAVKLILQLRALFVNAYQAFIPAIAELSVKNSTRISSIYSRALDLVISIALVVVPLTVLSADLIAQIWTGSNNPLFIRSIQAIAVAWFVNLVSAPSYFFNLGTGELSGNLVGHAITALVNLSLGFLFAFHFSSPGIIAGYCIAVVAGSLATITFFHRRRKPGFGSVRATAKLVMFSLLGLALALMLKSILDSSGHNIYVSTGFAMVTFLCAVAKAVWDHPIRAVVSDLVLQLRAADHYA